MTSYHHIICLCKDDYYVFLGNGVDLIIAVKSPDEAIKLSCDFDCPVYLSVEVNKHD